MVTHSFRNFIGQLVICFLLAFNTYPAMQTVVSDLSGVQVDAVPICTMTGIQYISSDLSEGDDTQQDASQDMDNCPFCQGNPLVFIPPSNQNSLGIKTTYSERLKVLQHKNTYYKVTLFRPQTRGPPAISFV